jgi:hypothetical protein
MIFGANTGDRVKFQLRASNGAVLAETTQTMDRPTAFRVPSMILRRNGPTDWPRGRYQGIVTVERSVDGGRVLSQTREAAVDVR